VLIGTTSVLTVWYKGRMAADRIGIVGGDLRNTAANRDFGALARAVLQQLLAEACTKGFNGTLGLTITSGNGTIQYVRKTSDQRLVGFTKDLAQSVLAGGNGRPIGVSEEESDAEPPSPA
jgi:hypothetical protein